MRRVFALCAVGAAAAGAALACTLAYSGYDDRFQPSPDGGDAGLAPFVTDDSTINAIAVTTSDLFFATNAGIRRMSLDGGAPVPWWNDASVGRIATDGTSKIAWISSSDDQVYEADVGNPSNAKVISIAKVGQFSKLAADGSHVAWTNPPASCPCELGEVRGWSDVATTALVFDGGGGKSIGAQDVAVDTSGVSVFVPSVGFRQYAHDGGAVCARAAGVNEQGAAGPLHAIASGPLGTPFFAIAPGSGASGQLTEFANACDDAGAEVDASASAVLVDATNVIWIRGDGSLEMTDFDGGSARPIAVGGMIAAMTSDATSIYFAIAQQVFRIAKAQ